VRERNEVFTEFLLVSRFACVCSGWGKLVGRCKRRSWGLERRLVSGGKLLLLNFTKFW
jgi:hypothetical protein